MEIKLHDYVIKDYYEYYKLMRFSLRMIHIIARRGAAGTKKESPLGLSAPSASRLGLFSMIVSR